MMKPIYLILLLAVMGCTTDELESTGFGGDSEDDICFATELLSRGTPITDATQLVSIGVYCAYTGLTDWSTAAPLNKMFNTRLNNTNGVWKYADGSIKWDNVTQNDKYTFFAYTPYASGIYDATTNPTGNGIVVNGVSGDKGVPSINYTVPTKVENQPDLMIATVVRNQNPTRTSIPLKMNHQLTSVGFSLLGYGEKVTKISISGISSTGKLALDGTWTLDPKNSLDFSSSINFDAGKNYYTANQTMSVNLMKGNGYLMMIPQQLDAQSKLNITMLDGTTKSISLNGQQWVANKRVNYSVYISPKGTIVITPSILSLTYADINVTDSVNVAVYPNDGTAKWTLSTSGGWLTMSRDKTGLNASSSLQISNSGKIYLKAPANTTAAVKTATIFINNQSDSIKCNITQAISPSDNLSGYGTMPANVTAYVGAFWRAGQKGERIIRFSPGVAANGNLGSWTAKVYWKDSKWAADDIILSTTKSPDSNISYSQVKTPGDAETYTLSGSNQVVTGKVTKDSLFYFRIGLKTAYKATDAAPARYAVILLSYNNNTKHHKIYIRQGEDPDYLMRPGDKADNDVVVVDNRSAARKISTYNLTAATFDVAVSTTNPAVFTEYPTQAGAFFQWYNTANKKYAYSPITTYSAGQWNITTVQWCYWNDYKADYEIGPFNFPLTTGTVVNFKRINDTSETAAVEASTIKDSEMRQTLHLTPFAGYIDPPAAANSVFGYYADGFFDRRMIESSPTGTAATCVAKSTSKIGYVGMLLINKYNNGSLFFPAAGTRSKSNNSLPLGSCGVEARYWTSTCMKAQPGSYWVFKIMKDWMGPSYYQAEWALSLRPVVVP